MPTLESQDLVADFIRYYVAPEFVFEEGHIRNTGAAAMNLVGTALPCTLDAGSGDYDPVAAGAEATATHFCVLRRKEEIAAGGRSQQEYTFLARGPAVCSIEGLPENDLDDAPYDLAALQTALEAIGVVVRDNRANLRAVTLNN